MDGVAVFFSLFASIRHTDPLRFRQSNKRIIFLSACSRSLHRLALETLIVLLVSISNGIDLHLTLIRWLTNHVPFHPSYFVLNVVRYDPSSYSTRPFLTPFGIHSSRPNASYDPTHGSMALCHPVPSSLLPFPGIISNKCWMIIKETCLFDETVQFIRNYKHCCSAASCGCGILESSMLLTKLHFKLPTGAHLLLMEC